MRLFELTGFTEEAGKPLAELYRKEERWQDLVMVLEHLHGHPEYDADWEECFELAMVYSEQLAQQFKAGEVLLRAVTPERLQRDQADRMFSLFEGLGYWKHAYDLGCHMLKDSAFDLAGLRLRVIAIAFDQLNLGAAAGQLALAGWQAGEYSSDLLAALRRHAQNVEVCPAVAAALEGTLLQALDTSLREIVTEEFLASPSGLEMLRWFYGLLGFVYP